MLEKSVKLSNYFKRLVCHAAVEIVITSNLLLCVGEKKGILPFVESIIEPEKEAGPCFLDDAIHLLPCASAVCEHFKKGQVNRIKMNRKDLICIMGF